MKKNKILRLHKLKYYYCFFFFVLHNKKVRAQIKKKKKKHPNNFINILVFPRQSPKSKLQSILS